MVAARHGRREPAEDNDLPAVGCAEDAGWDSDGLGDC